MEKSADEIKRAEHLAHVRTVLRAVDPNAGLLEVGDTLAKVMHSDSGAAEAFNKILQHISIKSLDENAQSIYNSYLVLHNRSLRAENKSNPEPFGGPDGTSDLLSVGYLYAREALRSPGASEKLNFAGLRAHLPQAANHIAATINGAFFAHLLLETKIRANRDANFGRTIRNAQSSLVAALPHLAEQQLAPQSGGGGGGGCWWLGLPAGSRACWLAGLIAVVIVVAKS